MGILPSAVSAFKLRPRNDYRICQDWSDAELADAAQALPMPLPLYDKMKRQQKITAVLAAKDRRLAIYNDMGTGKTLVVYSLIHYFAQLDGARRFLVGVPNRTNKDEWLSEGLKWFQGTRVVKMASSLAEKVKQLEDASEELTIFIDTFAGITRLCTAKVLNSPPKFGKKAAKGNHLVVDSKVIAALANSIDGVVADESSFLGNHDSLQTKIFDAFSKHERMIMYLLSGTPFGKDPTTLQPQIKMIDRGYTLGPTLGMFREVFFTTKQGYWSRFEYKFKKTMMATLNRYLAHCSVRFVLDKSELPATTRKKLMITLPADAASYYARAKEVLKKAAMSGEINETNGAFNALRAISSGFLPTTLDDGSRAVIDFKENPKLDALMDQLLMIGDYKCIVFHFFRHSGNILSAALKKKKIGHVLINGGTKNITEQRQKYMTDPSCKVMLLSADAGAFGLNLQLAKYGFVYESPVPVITRKQVLRRFIRPHSEYDKVVLVDLVVRGTVDERILEFHKTGADLFKAILSGGVIL